MYGWRARIGFINPAPVEVPAYNFYQVAPKGVTLVSTGLKVQTLTVDALAAAATQIGDSVKALAAEECDAIAVGGQPVLFTKGPGSEVALLEELQGITRIPIILSLMATIEAMKYLGMQRVVVAAPYKIADGKDGDAMDSMVTYFKAFGIDIVHLETIGVGSNLETGRLPIYVPYQTAMRAVARAPKADGLFLSGGRWAGMEHIQALENDTGLPVVTTTQSWIWKAFRQLGIMEPIPERGRLLGAGLAR